MVVACVAGFGASAGFYAVEGTVSTYAAELFGDGSGDVKAMWPKDATLTTTTRTLTNGYMRPHVKVTLPDTDAGEGTLTFTLKNGAVFATSVSSTDFTNNDGSTVGLAGIAIEDGGDVGDDYVTIKLSGIQATRGDDGTTYSVVTGDTNTDGTIDATDATNVDAYSFLFRLPELKGLSVLAKETKTVTVAVSAESTTGVFPDGRFAVQDGVNIGLKDAEGMEENTASNVIVKSAQAVKLTKLDNMAGTARININDRTMLEAHAHPWSTFFCAAGTSSPYCPRTYSVTGQDGWAAQILQMELTVTSSAGDEEAILQWDGTRVDSDVAGVLDVDVTGTRGALQEGAATVFVNWNSDPRVNKPEPPAARAIDSGEMLTNDGSSATFTAGGFSIDPGLTDEKTDTLTRTIGVYYIPDGKMELAHGGSVKATAFVNYTLRTSKDEDAVSNTTSLQLHGVFGELKAYAIPFDGNGKGDKANVRARCEVGDRFSGGASCRVFLECWDDMGMRSFGEAGMIAASSLVTWDAAAIEGVVGIEDPTSRHSCRVLSTGMPSIQTLVRDGSSNTLVNNSYVED